MFKLKRTSLRHFPVLCLPIILLIHAAIAQPGTDCIAGAAEESESVTTNSFFGVFSTHNHDSHQHFKDQTGMSEQDFYDWADTHRAILDFHWSRTGADIIWECIEPVLGAGYDWDNDKDTDDNIKAYYAQGQINLIATISPARDRIAREDWWLYEEDFKNYVRAVVERYDGDGIDDADANVRVNMWQASNEVLAWQSRGWTADQYVMFVTWMEEAVHQADPDAEIMLIASQTGAPYMRFMKNSIDDLIAAGVPFDAVDIHNWAPYDDNGVPGFPMEEVEDCRAFLDSRGLYDVEIFTCENGTWFGCPVKPSGEPEPEQTEQEQARFLAQRIVYSPSVGLDHFLWNNICEWYNFGGNPNSIYNCMGLVSDGAQDGDVAERLNTERICYWTYKMLAEALDKPANSFVGRMSFTVDNNRYGYEYEETETAIHKYVLWSWIGDQDITFTVPEENYRVTNLITDRYGNILEQYYLTASDDQLTISVGEDPLLIQPVEN